MMMRMSSWVACGAALVAAAMTVTVWSASAGEEADATAPARETWSSDCQSCHTAPDTAFETDRAFLRQIIETS